MGHVVVFYGHFGDIIWRLAHSNAVNINVMKTVEETINHIARLRGAFLRSKQVFTLMLFMTTLTDTGGEDDKPVLTIPTR